MDINIEPIDVISISLPIWFVYITFIAPRIIKIKSKRARLKYKAYLRTEYFNFNKYEQQINNYINLWFEVAKNKNTVWEPYNKLITSNGGPKKRHALEIPITWQMDDIHHTIFAFEIVSQYSSFIVNNKNIFIATTDLPFQLEIIKKAICFNIDYIEQDTNHLYIPDKHKQIELLQGLLYSMSLFILNIPKHKIPENSVQGLKEMADFNLDNPVIDDFWEIDVVDYLDIHQWIKKASHYKSQKRFELAKRCISKAKTIDSTNTMIKVFEADLYLTLAKEAWDKNETKLSIEFMKRARSFDNAEAEIWLSTKRN